MVGGALALALLAVDHRTLDPLRQRRGREDEVDAHPLLLGEPQALVVPVGVGAGTGRVGTHHVGVPGLDDGLEGGPLAGRDVRALEIELHAPHVLVKGCDVPVADEGDLGSWVLAVPPCGAVPQPGQPVELVGHVRVLDLAPVGHVERPHPYAAHDRCDRPRLRLGRLPPGGHAVEADLHVVEADP